MSTQYPLQQSITLGERALADIKRATERRAVLGEPPAIHSPEPDSVSPNHYQFPGGAEVRFISEWLTANSAQALQYIARSSRIDGNNKGDATEDIRKAIRFLEFELERLEQ